ncbi:hypothetical protein V5738_18090 [Salinisphaera sp. SPP-AMP-43]|uniref:hypothetical protein n=1 Tax=Salinisphaera sp. SPP-AMP-43 TaxID=3121288 RepID=UPI003C6E5F5A
MSATRQSNIIAWICEGAGFVGMSATVAACALAYNASSQLGFWIAIATSLAANLLYIAHIFAQRFTGARMLTWREMILATLVPFVALLVTIAIAGEVGGLFQLPFVQPDQPDPQVINIGPKDAASQGGSGAD